MAISVVVLVGDAYEWLPDLVNLAKRLKVGGGFEKDVDMWVISSYVYVSHSHFIQWSGHLTSCKRPHPWVDWIC